MTEILREPFLIRGHHLREYTKLFNQSNPETLANTVAIEIEQRRLKGLRVWVDYANDVIGDSTRSGYYEKSMKGIFEEFMDLPDEATIDIIEAQPDKICSVCIIGAHCRERYQHGNQKWDTLKGDRRAMHIFYNEAKRLGLVGSMEVFIEKGSFVDAPDVEIQRLRTTARAVRNVLKSLSNIDKPFANLV